ncbi:aspartate dehydrogenase domain-containing protein [uncultured Turicimonas sp.]|uniref:aspartate dehydrogenase domain-containing protein n=1 Tax=uncultured Turicimonas sp. TaxID=1918607 RepID=UPI002803A00F|nr:aspartate dehydrogenase domain-containing protein [uncultured Turicimonas sp.]
MKKIAVLGCGALSQTFCMNVSRLLEDDYFITAVLAKHHEHAVDLSMKIGSFACHNLRELLSLRPDIVVEFAGVEAVEKYAEDILSSGCDLVIASVGALDDKDFREHIIKVAKDHERHIYVTSGAIGGMDIMSTFAAYGNPEVSIVSVKPPQVYDNSPYLANKPVRRDQEVVVFEGDVHAAIRGFPRNVNVSVATALASHAHDMKVKLISDPSATRNTHTVTLHNPIMDAQLTFSAEPDHENERASMSAAWSVIALLKNLSSPLSFF